MVSFVSILDRLGVLADGVGLLHCILGPGLAGWWYFRRLYRRKPRASMASLGECHHLRDPLRRMGALRSRDAVQA
jgi:hypothetical protein